MKRVINLYHPSASAEEVARLTQVEEKAWNSSGAEIAASSNKIEKRIAAFQEGVTTAVYEGRVVGSQFAFRTNEWDGNPDHLTSWDEYTNYGYYHTKHTDQGAYGFLVGVGVIPEFRGQRFDWGSWKHMKASELLIAYTLQTMFGLGVQAVIGNARVPAYHTKSELTIDEYCAIRRADGKLYDPVLRFHERMGARILKPVAYSLEDAESLDAGCWVIYDHPFEP